MGAGIIPIAVYKGTLFVLLGKERFKENNKNLWCDFGGSVDKKNIYEINNPYYTAIREGVEELNGLLGDFKILKNNVDKNSVCNISNNENTYHSFLFNIDYDINLPIYFNNQNKFIEEHLYDIASGDNGFFEKSEIRWFSISQLKYIIAYNRFFFRKHFISIIKEIIRREKSIRKQIIKNSKTIIL